MMKRTALSLVAATLFVTSAGLAIADEAGRVQLNGREVILQSDGTWKYSDAETAAASADCGAGQGVASKKLPVSFCLPQGWRMMANPSESMEFEAVQNEKDIYVGLITERTSMNDAAIRDAVLYNAASAAGIKQADVPVVLEEKRTFAGQDWNYIVYDVTFTGATFRFANYYKALGDKGSTQLVFWASKGYFDEDKAQEEAVAATLNLKQ